MKWREGLTFSKDPQSTEPRGIDWTRYLAELDDDETVSTSTWETSAGLVADVDDTTPLTLSSPTIVTGALKTQVRYGAGSVGQQYRVTNHIVTSSGVIDERSFLVTVRER